MGRKSLQAIMKVKQVVIDKKQRNVRRLADKNTKDYIESVS